MGKGPENGIYLPHPAAKLAVETISDVFMGTVHVEGEDNVDEAVSSGDAIEFVVGPHADAPIAIKSLKQIGFPDDVAIIQGIKLNRRVLTDALVRGVRRIQVWPSSLDANSQDEKLEKNSTNRTAINAARRALNDTDNPTSLMVFPEGRRSNGMIWADPDSAIYLRLSSGVKIIPVGIIGGDQVLPMHAVMPRWHTPTVRFGEPIEADELKAKYAHAPREEFNKLLIDDVMVEVARLLPEEYRGVYSERVRYETAY